MHSRISQSIKSRRLCNRVPHDGGYRAHGLELGGGALMMVGEGLYGGYGGQECFTIQWTPQLVPVPPWRLEPERTVRGLGTSWGSPTPGGVQDEILVLYCDTNRNWQDVVGHFGEGVRQSDVDGNVQEGFEFGCTFGTLEVCTERPAGTE